MHSSSSSQFSAAPLSQSISLGLIALFKSAGSSSSSDVLSNSTHFISPPGVTLKIAYFLVHLSLYLLYLSAELFLEGVVEPAYVPTAPQENNTPHPPQAVEN